jgi:hypothetical protein
VKIEIFSMFSSKKETKKINFFNKFFSSPKPKRRAVFFVLLAVLVIGFSFFLMVHSSHAQYVEDPNINPAAPGSNVSISNAFSGVGKALGEGLLGTVMAIICGVLAVIAYFCKLFLMFAGWTLDFTLNPALYSFTSNTMIVQGWTIVRDVCNLFFLLVLLFIAICTILKIEKYHAKKTLLMLIIMALLINFSKPIAIFIFDGSQLLMGEFLKQLTGNSQSPSTMYAQASSIAKFMYDDFQGYFGSNASGMEIAVQYLFIIVFLFMFAVALFVMALFLIIRIVAIMLLIIVSPLAFFAAIVPDFSNMSSSWWSALFKYSFYGPAAAFFLLLATKLSNVLATTINPQSSMPGMGGNITQHIVQYLVVLVFLYASIIMSQQFGIAAASGIVGNANKFMKWAGGMSKGGGMWGAGARGVAYGGRTTGVSGGIGQAIGASRFGKYLTKKGRETAQKDREAGVAEKFGVEGAKEAREKQKVAEQREQWKKEGKTEGDFKKSLHSKDPIERKAAALELVKQGRVKDDETYELVLDSLKGGHATVGDAIAKDHDEVKDAIKEVGKKRIDLVANEEAKRTRVDKLEVGVKLMGKANPGAIKDWDIEKITADPKLEQALSDTFAKYGNNSKIQDKILEDMPATKYAAFIKTLKNVAPSSTASPRTTPPPDVPWG